MKGSILEQKQQISKNEWNPERMKFCKIKDLQISDLDLSLVVLDLQDEHTLLAYTALFEDCFGKRPNIDAPLFHWWNIERPEYKNLNFAFIDNSSKKMIAAYGLQPGDSFIGGAIIKYALCTSVMTHPQYGGKGLFVAIGKEALAYVKKIGINFCFGVPNEKALSGHLKAGWRLLTDLHFYEHFPLQEKIPAVKGIETGILKEFTDADHFSFLNDNYNFYFMRTAAWCAWRNGKLHSKYINFGLNNDLEKGYMVVKEYTDAVNKLKKLHIVDFAYNTHQCFSKLVDHCCWMAQNGDYNLVNLWHFENNNTETDILSIRNFEKTEQKNALIVHELGNNIPIPEDKRHVTLFDNDVY